MTLESTVNQNKYVGNGATKTFPFTFKVWKKSEVAVWVGDGVVENEVSATCSINLTASGGTVTFRYAPASGKKIVIRRSMPYIQEDDYRNGTRFDAEEVEDRLDQDCAERQDLRLDVGRAIKIPLTSSMSADEILRLLLQAIQALQESGDVTGLSLVKATGSTEYRTLADRFGDIVNVKDFGAKGDGTTDDTAAFLAAMLVGREVFVPAGTYVVDASEVFAEGAGGVNRLHGEGVLVDADGNPAKTPEGKPVWLPSVASSAKKKLDVAVRRYVDGVNGDDSNDGLTSGTAWKTMDRFFQLLNEGYNDIRCNILSGGVYFVHTANVISDCAVHVTALNSCASTPYVWFLNGSGSVVFYNSHVNLYSKSASYKLHFGSSKVHFVANEAERFALEAYNGGKQLVYNSELVYQSDTQEMFVVSDLEHLDSSAGYAVYSDADIETVSIGAFHSDNSLITVRETKLDFAQVTLYACGAFFANVEFRRLSLLNSKFRSMGSSKTLTTTYPEKVGYDYKQEEEDIEDEEDDKTANILARNSDLYLPAKIYAVPRTGSVAKFMECHNCNVYLGAHVYPFNAEDDLNFKYIFEFRGCRVSGPVFDSDPNGNGSYWAESLGYGTSGAYASEGTEMCGGGASTHFSFAGSSAGYRVLSAGVGGSSLKLDGKDYSGNKFVLTATDGTDSSTLTGNLNAFLTWDGEGIRPGEGGVSSLGTPNYRWANVYISADAVSTSDSREKDNLAAPTEALMRAWGGVRFLVFQFNDAIEKKGVDAARLHVGIVAQEVQAAFEAEGLDASRFGLFCYDEWEDEYEVETVVDVDERIDVSTGELVPAQTHVERKKVQTAGNRYGIRYAEALALECAYQRWLGQKRDAEIESLKARLSAIEGE